MKIEPFCLLLGEINFNIPGFPIKLTVFLAPWLFSQSLSLPFHNNCLQISDPHPALEFGAISTLAASLTKYWYPDQKHKLVAGAQHLLRVLPKSQCLLVCLHLWTRSSVIFPGQRNTSFCDIVPRLHLRVNKNKCKIL